VAAVDRLRARGETRVGCLFVVGEERGSDGARGANGGATVAVSRRRRADRQPPRLATRGMLRCRLRAPGRAAHSSFPELGDRPSTSSLDALVQAARDHLARREEHGRTHYTVGLISGGIAPNVVCRRPMAELMYQTVY
jgi:acetylornithine deacetylase